MAARFFINGGVDNNWGTISNWSLTSGGAGGQAVPLATDDVHFDANSPNCTVNTSNRVALTLDCTGYTNTITMANAITVSGSITLAAAMSFSGSGELQCVLNGSATATLTSNGKACNVPLRLNTAGTSILTVSGTWDNSALVTAFSSSTIAPMNGGTVNCGAGLTHAGSTGNVNGTLSFVMTGTGTLTPNTSGGGFQCNLEINAPGGTVTIGTANPFIYGSKAWKYTAGTVVATGSTIRTASIAPTITVNAAGLTLGTLDLQIGTTVNGTNGFAVGTLSSSANLTHSLKSGNTYNINTALTLGGSKAAPIALTASTPSSPAILKVSPSATQEVAWVNATDIDSNGGEGVYDYMGTLTRTANWSRLTSPPTRTMNNAFYGGCLL